MLPVHRWIVSVLLLCASLLNLMGFFAPPVAQAASFSCSTNIDNYNPKDFVTAIDYPQSTGPDTDLTVKVTFNKQSLPGKNWRFRVHAGENNGYPGVFTEQSTVSNWVSESDIASGVPVNFVVHIDNTLRGKTLVIYLNRDAGSNYELCNSASVTVPNPDLDAGSCTVEMAQNNQISTPFNIKVTTNEISKFQYTLTIAKGDDPQFTNILRQINITDSSQTISINPSISPELIVGSYLVSVDMFRTSVATANEKKVCATTNFKMINGASSDAKLSYNPKCTFSPSNPTSTSNMLFTGSGFAINLPYVARVTTIPDASSQIEQNSVAVNTLSGTSNGTGAISFILGKLAVGDYRVDVYDQNNTSVCFEAFKVSDTEGGGARIGGSDKGTDTRTIGAMPGCSEGRTDCTKAAGQSCDNGTAGIKTAIGCVPTDPVGLINGILSFSIGIAGGIALLLMMIGSFEMVTSGGDPKNLQNGRERFVSALIGLLFILFSVVFLKIIGVDILGLDKISAFKFT